MNLKDNLRKIRKDNNLSQEDLAEKLGVSRQSVSKWESGSAYPEMDKVIQLCNMFNLNIDDLLNQDIKKVEKTKQSTFDVGKYIDDFLKFFNKTISMFSSMRFRDKFKCLFEQLIIFLLFLFIFYIIGSILSNLFSPLSSILPDNIYYVIRDILSALFSTACIIFGLILMVQVFKTRYLNYYNISDKEVVEEIEKNEDSNKNEKEAKPFIIKNENIIIRDPKHSEYRFINGILKLIVFCFKLFIGFIGLFFCGSFVFFMVCFVLSFLIVKSGLLFVGILLCVLAALLLNYSILNMMYKFIVNQKINKSLMGILILISLLLGGLGIGISITSAKDYSYSVSPNEKYLVTTEQNIKMNKNLFFLDYNDEINYIEEDREDVKIESTYVKGYEISFSKVRGYYEIHKYCNGDNIDIYKSLLKSVNNKEIIDIDYHKINIYASKKNIRIIKDNYKKNFVEE